MVCFIEALHIDAILARFVWVVNLEPNLITTGVQALINCNIVSTYQDTATPVIPAFKKISNGSKPVSLEPFGPCIDIIKTIIFLRNLDLFKDIVAANTG